MPILSRKRRLSGGRFSDRIEGYAASNRSAARIIYADPLQYPGLPLQWACMVLSLPLPDSEVQGTFTFATFEQAKLWQ